MLYTQDDSRFIPATRDQIVTEALNLVRGEFHRGPVLTNPRETREFLVLAISTREHEVFVAIFLDNRNAVITIEEMFRGTIDGATVHPREVVKSALKHNATAIIFAHNHPSNVAEPSQADEFITRRLRDALALVDIRVLDHLIVSRHGVASMAELGMI